MIKIFRDDAEKYGCPHCGGSLFATSSSEARSSVSGSVFEVHHKCTSDKCRGRVFSVVHPLNPGQEGLLHHLSSKWNIVHPHPFVK